MGALRGGAWQVDVAARPGCIRRPGRAFAHGKARGARDCLLADLRTARTSALAGVVAAFHRVGDRARSDAIAPTDRDGPGGQGSGRRAGRTRTVDIVVHSQAASRELEAMGWAPPTVLPHPVFRPLPRPDDPETLERSSCVVSTNLLVTSNCLSRLHPAAPPRFPLAGCRTGWPQIAGWEVDDRFLSESELDQRIGGSAAVLIPYSRFYQSGIAVRALELGVPVVGPRHPFLMDLFGAQWPGLISTGNGADAWADGLAKVTHSSARLTPLSAAFRDRCEREWAEYLHKVLGISPAETTRSSTPK